MAAKTKRFAVVSTGRVSKVVTVVTTKTTTRTFKKGRTAPAKRGAGKGSAKKRPSTVRKTKQAKKSGGITKPRSSVAKLCKKSGGILKPRDALVKSRNNSGGILKPRSAPNAAVLPASSAGKSLVYVLELEGGYVYVGKTSRGVAKRLAEHMGGSPFGGAAFTRLHRPTGKLMPRMGNLQGDGDGPERDETLRQMYVRGPQWVRGWKYVRSAALKPSELHDIECNIRELFDLCRRCGRTGHFARQCAETRDRHGLALGM